MNKEIEIMDFVLKEQAKRNINSNARDELNKEILGRAELKNRNIAHFNEVLIPKRKSNFKGYAKLGAIMVTSTILAFALFKSNQYENRPIKIAVNELLSDAGLNRTDNARKIDGKMTQEELTNYAIENGLSIEQIEAELNKFSKKNKLDYEFVQEKVEENNQGLFRR